MALRALDAGHTYDAGTPYENVGVGGISLAVEPGELLLVLGPTGSGKSTLLKMLAGLLEPTAGEVSVDGDPLAGAGRAPRGSVGLVFQDPESQLFAETVATDVAFGPTNLGATPEEAARAVSDALTAVGLDAEAFGPRSPFGLSGGEARRVAIAGVLAMQPRYLLLDEPTAGLDARGRAAVCDAIAAIKAARAGVVVVTHDAEQFLSSAESVLVLVGSAAAFSGPTSALLEDPGILSRAGLLVPEVLRAQMLAEDRATLGGAHAIDPRAAARRIAAAGGWGR